MTATGVEALNIALGIDDAHFMCHHGMKEGEPTRLCVGAIAAIIAPDDIKQSAIRTLSAKLDSQDGPDEVRVAFDDWVTTIDPDSTMDDYTRGRAYLKSPLYSP